MINTFCLYQLKAKECITFWCINCKSEIITNVVTPEIGVGLISIVVSPLNEKKVAIIDRYVIKPKVKLIYESLKKIPLVIFYILLHFFFIVRIKTSRYSDILLLTLDIIYAFEKKNANKVHQKKNNFRKLRL